MQTMRLPHTIPSAYADHATHSHHTECVCRPCDSLTPYRVRMQTMRLTHTIPSAYADHATHSHHTECVCRPCDSLTPYRVRMQTMRLTHTIPSAYADHATHSHHTECVCRPCDSLTPYRVRMQTNRLPHTIPKPKRAERTITVIKVQRHKRTFLLGVARHDTAKKRQESRRVEVRAHSDQIKVLLSCVREATSRSVWVRDGRMAIAFYTQRFKVWSLLI